MNPIILCYHKVGPLDEEGRFLNVDPRRFESHVRFYARRNRPFVLARDFAGSVPTGSVCFSFDDAYLSALEHAPEKLQKYGKLGSFFAVSDLVGEASTWDGERARPLAGFDALRAAQSAGHEISNHTATHPALAELSEQDQRRQILCSHVRLVDEGLRPSSICYPYGSYNEDTLRVAAEAGYKVGLSLHKGPVAAGYGLLTLPRVVVAFGDALPSILYKTLLLPRLRGVKLESRYKVNQSSSQAETS